MESPDKGSAFLMDKRVSIQKAGSQLRNKTRTQFQNSTKRSYCRFKIMCEFLSDHFIHLYGTAIGTQMASFCVNKLWAN